MKIKYNNTIYNCSEIRVANGCFSFTNEWGEKFVLPLEIINDIEEV